MSSGDGPKVIEYPGFKRELKKLLKKYPTLRKDLETFKKAVILAHGNSEMKPESMGFFPVAGLGTVAEGIFIAKKLACKTLKGSGSRSGIRVVYRISEDCLHLMYIELFHKKEKPLPDPDRIQSILKVRLLPEEIDPE